MKPTIEEMLAVLDDLIRDADDHGIAGVYIDEQDVADLRAIRARLERKVTRRAISLAALRVVIAYLDSRSAGEDVAPRITESLVNDLTELGITVED